MVSERQHGRGVPRRGVHAEDGAPVPAVAQGVALGVALGAVVFDGIGPEDVVHPAELGRAQLLSSTGSSASLKRWFIGLLRLFV